MVALIMMVGTGTGPEDGRKSLAHGLAHSIDRWKPERIFFIGSSESRNMIPLIRDSLIRDFRRDDLPVHDFIEIVHIDDFNDCFQKIRRAIEKCNNEETLIDYTSGTKTMTMSAAIASMLFHKKLVMVEGERIQGIVVKGTERTKEQNLYSAYDQLLIEDVKDEFNKYRFSAALDILDRVVIFDYKDEMKMLIQAYHRWDLFDHEGANEILGKIRLEWVKNTEIDANRAFLGRLSTMKNLKLKYSMLLADLLNNARRRHEEGRYDDAVARLYRAVELIAQIKLHDYNIEETPIPIEKLRTVLDKEVLNRYEQMADNRGKIRIGVREMYQLLEKLGWRDAMTIYKRLESYLQQRNSSILAHGITPVKENMSKEFLEKIEQISLDLTDGQNFKTYLEQSRFPRL